MPEIGVVGPEVPVQETPSEVYGGNMAMTIQEYTSLNCKTGSQWEASSYVPALAAGANVDVIVVVGALPLLLKSRTIGISGIGIELNIYENPTYTGGTEAPAYNMNSWNPKERQMTIISGATVTDVGTQVAATRHLLGNSGQGNSVISTHSGDYPGLERVCKPGSVYLLRSTSMESTNPQVYSAYTTWYEGELDVPTQL